MRLGLIHSFVAGAPGYPAQGPPSYPQGGVSYPPTSYAAYPPQATYQGYPPAGAVNGSYPAGYAAAPNGSYPVSFILNRRLTRMSRNTVAVVFACGKLSGFMCGFPSKA